MRGCSVLTRPSRISGKPVTCATSVTATPCSASSRAVPPVERILYFCRCRNSASSSTPVLSDTLISACGVIVGFLWQDLFENGGRSGLAQCVVARLAAAVALLLRRRRHGLNRSLLQRQRRNSIKRQR